ncbi:group-specific protein [Sediminibacillus sp. JSM 1682029]|uniref:group-specific protein n=1 Tax=Sediminibacillus sp. JSM 1682029 TaxID=3229857 RepID=UPI0035244C9C
MIEVNVDQSFVEDICREEVQKRLDKAEFDLVMWDKNELVRRTCMSWSSIQRTFFYERDFPKVKLGGKWYFPAAKTTRFLLDYLDRIAQSN